MRNCILFFMLFPLLLSAQNNASLMKKRGVDTSKYVPKGLMVGDKAPIIIGTSINGNKVNSNEIIKEKEVVVIFYRGKWCPVCNRYLTNLHDSLALITGKKAEVLVIGPETFDNAEKTANKTGGDFVLIPDTNLKILTDYDVLFNVTKGYQNKIKTFLLTDIAKNNNQEEAILPVPATYIIGKNGLIKWRQFDYDYTKRASVKSIIKHLE